MTPPFSTFSVPLPKKPTRKRSLVFHFEPLPVTVAVPVEPAP